MSDNLSSRSEALTPQLQAELADFDEILREFEIEPNSFNDLSLTSEEYQVSMQVLQEFLDQQEGFGLEPQIHPLLEQPEPDLVQGIEEDDAAPFTNSSPAPDYPAVEMLGEQYSTDVDTRVGPDVELNLEPGCNTDVGELELDDSFLMDTQKNGTIMTDDDTSTNSGNHNFPADGSSAVRKSISFTEITSVMKRKWDRKENLSK